MQVFTTKALPSANELTEILKKEFSNKYSYKKFGLGTDASVLVRKSFFVGAQISINGNKITIDGGPPTVSASFFSIILQLVAGLFRIFAFLPYRKLEKEIGIFINKRYN